MRNMLIAFAVALMMAGPGATGCLRASEQTAVKSASAPTFQAESHDGVMKIKNAAGTEGAQENEKARRKAEAAKQIVLARVNGSAISMYELIRAMNIIAPEYIREGEQPSAETTAEIRKEALDRLIFEELAVQQAEKEGINPRPDVIENVVKQVKQNLGTEEAYKEYLSRHDLTEEALRSLIKRSQRYEMITANEIYRKVKLDEKQLKAEYEKEKIRYVLPEHFVAQDVVFLMGSNEEAAEKKAGEVLAAIRKNNNDVWKLVPDGTFIVREMTITRERNPEVYNIMARMKVGHVSGVIRDKDGLHIIKVGKKDSPRQATFEEAKASIEPEFLVPAQKKRREEWEKELKKNATIEIFQAEVKKG